MEKCVLPSSIIAIGSSTGGPGALSKIISVLPKDFHIPIVIVQHIEESFLKGFIQWLQSEHKREFRIAEENTCISEGIIYVASGKGNLEINTQGYFQYTTPQKNQIYTPNIDHFFKTLSELPLVGYAAILTGMGSDGAEGLKKLADKKWNTYVQSSQSCVVSGMPDAAMKLSPRHCSAELVDIAHAFSSYNLSINRIKK